MSCKNIYMVSNLGVTIETLFHIMINGRANYRGFHCKRALRSSRLLTIAFSVCCPPSRLSSGVGMCGHGYVARPGVILRSIVNRFAPGGLSETWHCVIKVGPCHPERSEG